MSQVLAVLWREAKIRATNVTFLLWDLVFPLGYLLVFGVGVTRAMGWSIEGVAVGYNEFFLAGVLAMASFSIASNTAWGFFMDRDNGIFYEMLTYPMTRGQYLVGKVLFNLGIAMVQAAVTITLAAALFELPLAVKRLPLLLAAVAVGTAGWFFFYAVFALRMRRNDAFNTVTSIFYFVFLFASSMFYPLEPLPAPLRQIAAANPITWQVDVLRYATIGLGDPHWIALESAAFTLFSLVAFAAATRALRDQQ